jgi:hypothetical protein
MTLKEAIDSGLPFKMKHHEWWFDSKSYPKYLDEGKHRNCYSDKWETGSITELEEQTEKMKNYLE